MYFDWEITDDLSEITIDEFNRDWNGIYGFARFQVDDDIVGFIPPKGIDLEGNNDILYWITNTIECGISILKKEDFECWFLSLNKLKFLIKDVGGIQISLVDDENNTLWEHIISFASMNEEISTNYKKLYNFILRENPELLEANEIKNVQKLYIEYKNLYLQNRFNGESISKK